MPPGPHQACTSEWSQRSLSNSIFSYNLQGDPETITSFLPLDPYLLHHVLTGSTLRHPHALGASKNLGDNNMKNLILKSLNCLHKDEAGQGLVEYALIIALVAFAAVVAMQTLAVDINAAFTGIGALLGSYVP